MRTRLRETLVSGLSKDISPRYAADVADIYPTLRHVEMIWDIFYFGVYGGASVLCCMSHMPDLVYWYSFSHDTFHYTHHRIR